MDLYGGLDDLAERRLRTPVTPEQSFDDDPRRMLRQLGTLTTEVAPRIAPLLLLLSAAAETELCGSGSDMARGDSPRAGFSSGMFPG